jgi:endonuclease/exonuclease/phosphatase family metal-dependent hydrolase
MKKLIKLYILSIILFVGIDYFFEANAFVMLLFTPFRELIWLPLPLAFAFAIIADYTDKTQRIGRVLIGLVLIILTGTMSMYYHFHAMTLLMVVLVVVAGIMQLYKMVKLQYTLSMYIIFLVYLSYYWYGFANLANWPSQHDLKVTTYNMDVSVRANNRSDVVQLLEKENPDVACFQEVKGSDKRFFRERFGQMYPYQLGPLPGANAYQSGIIISKLPFRHSANIAVADKSFRSNMRINHVVVAVDSITSVSIYNFHLISNGFTFRKQQYNNYTLRKKIDLERKNYVRRVHEARRIAAIAKRDSLPVILVGDFNDVANSNVLAEFKPEFKLALKQAGPAHWATFGKSMVNTMWDVVGIDMDSQFNFIGIDHVMLNNRLRCEAIYTVDYGFSDHSPVVALVRLK